MPRYGCATALLVLALAHGTRAADEAATRPPQADRSQSPLNTPQSATAQDPAESQRQPPGSTAENKEPGRTRPQSSRVVFITTKDCPKCERELARLRRPGGDFQKMQARGWKIGKGEENHLQIVDREALGDLIAQLDPRDFPTVACISGNEIVRSFKSGCTTPLDMWTFAWLAKGVDERPPGSVPEAARVETTGHFPLRGNHWSIDEDWNPTRDKVVSHLRGPNHGAHIAANWEIETWSYEELRSLHDHLHEQEMASGNYVGRSQPASNPFSATRKQLGR
jgi:hypothetical protein